MFYDKAVSLVILTLCCVELAVSEEINATSSQVNNESVLDKTPEAIDRTSPSQIELGDSDVKLGDSEVKLEDSEAKLGDSEVKSGDSEIDSVNVFNASDPRFGTDWEKLTYESLYEEGIKHYLENNWHQCVSFFESAIEDYRWHTTTLTKCRRACKQESTASPLLSPDLDTSQTFYETIVRNALCLLKCRDEKFGPRKGFSAPVLIDRDFEMKKTYDYLQLCYFKVGRYQDAANAAVTVLASQPDHQVMTNNLNQYIENFSVDTEDLTNLELEPYAQEYVAADHAHQEEDFENSVKHMEKALSLYWEALADCRAMCEEPFDMGWFPDFVSSVANHFTFTFRCKRRCPSKLSNLFGEEIFAFLPSMFNYLQFGYYKLNDIPKTCSAVESCLELFPTDTSMINNKQFYLKELQKSSRYFVPRKEVLAHVARERYENNLLNFIDTEFVFVQDAQRLRKETSQKIAETPQDNSIIGRIREIFSQWPAAAAAVSGKGEL